MEPLIHPSLWQLPETEPEHWQLYVILNMINFELHIHSINKTSSNIAHLWPCVRPAVDTLLMPF